MKVSQLLFTKLHINEHSDDWLLRCQHHHHHYYCCYCCCCCYYYYYHYYYYIIIIIDVWLTVTVIDMARQSL